MELRADLDRAFAPDVQTEISMNSYKHKDFSVPWDESPLDFLSRLIVAPPPRRESRALTSINDLRKAAFLNKEPEGELLSLAAPSRPSLS